MMTTQQAAERRGVWPVTVRKWILRGLLPARKVGRDWLIEEAALDAFTPPPAGRPSGKAARRMAGPRGWETFDRNRPQDTPAGD